MKSRNKRGYSRSKRRASRFGWPVLGAAAAVLLVIVAGSFGFAASMEEKDTFCASCHTQPESTFFERSQAAQAVDLASFHTTKETKCIDCHSGIGVGGRVGAILLGSRNAFAHFTGTAQQPAPLTVAISDGNCLKCHEQIYQEGGFDNHFHSFLPRWQRAQPNAAASCVDCHSSHTTGAPADLAFLAMGPTEQVCQSCHAAIGE